MPQWAQPQPPLPQPPPAFFFGGVASGDSDFSFFFPLSLKSVAYQPLPLSWKPDAEISFLSVDWPQAGQSLRTGSLIFWMASSCKIIGHDAMEQHSRVTLADGRS